MQVNEMMIGRAGNAVLGGIGRSGSGRSPRVEYH